MIGNYHSMKDSNWIFKIQYRHINRFVVEILTTGPKKERLMKKTIIIIILLALMLIACQETDIINASPSKEPLLNDTAEEQIKAPIPSENFDEEPKFSARPIPTITQTFVIDENEKNDITENGTKLGVIFNDILNEMAYVLENLEGAEYRLTNVIDVEYGYEGDDFVEIYYWVNDTQTGKSLGISFIHIESSADLYMATVFESPMGDTKLHERFMDYCDALIIAYVKLAENSPEITDDIGKIGYDWLMSGEYMDGKVLYTDYAHGDYNGRSITCRGYLE